MKTVGGVAFGASQVVMFAFFLQKSIFFVFDLEFDIQGQFQFQFHRILFNQLIYTNIHMNNIYQWLGGPGTVTKNTLTQGPPLDLAKNICLYANKVAIDEEFKRSEVTEAKM